MPTRRVIEEAHAGAGAEGIWETGGAAEWAEDLRVRRHVHFPIKTP